MTWELYLAFVAASFIIVIVPGPTVTLILANSLTHGARAAMLNVAGTQVGLVLYMAAVVAGLASIIAAMGQLFDWVRLLGAAYLVWLGWKLLRSASFVDANRPPAEPRGGFFLQGFLVILSNPKALLFFGAFLPQFVDPSGDYLRQITLLGVTFMVIGTVCDGAYGLLAAQARRALSPGGSRWLARISGGFLIGGGIWLALARVR